MIILIWAIGVCGAVAMVAYESYWFAGIVLAASFLLSLFVMAAKKTDRDYEDAMERLKKMNETLDSLEAITPVKRPTFPASKVGKG